MNCDLCNKNTELTSYDSLSLCTKCLKEYKAKEYWLIRTTNKKILGPYDTNKIQKLILDKKIVFLDEIAKPGRSWELIKNITSFKNIALDTGYDLDEATVDFDYSKISQTPTPIMSTNKYDKQVVNSRKLRLMTPSRSYYFSYKKIFPTLGILFIIILSFSIYRTYRKDKLNIVNNYQAEELDFNKLYIKAREYEEGGLFEKARTLYEKALTYRPNHPSARIKKLAIDLRLSKNLDSIEKELQILYADSNLGKIPDMDDQTDIRIFLGILETKKRNYNSALAYFNQALAIKPTSAFIYYNIGRILFIEKKYSESIEYFRNAQKLSPSFIDAILYEAKALLEMKEYEMAHMLFASSTLQNIYLREFYIIGAYAAVKARNESTAISLLKRYVFSDYMYNEKLLTPLYQIERADLLDECLEYLEQVEKQITDKTWVLYAKASIYSLKGDYKEAKSIVQSNNSTDMSILSFINYQEKDYDNAFENAQKALEIDYSNVLAHIYAGKVMFIRKNWGQALNHFTKAQSMGGSIGTEAKYLEGEVYDQYGKKDEAIIIWKKLLSQNPKYKIVWEKLQSSL